MDDWSIVHSASQLAATGHIQYNGWEAATLGWFLYPAAALMRLFGSSFWIARATTVMEGCLVVWLMLALYRRSGLGRAAAVLGTLTVVVSPIFLLNATTFMTDVPGMLALLVCAYCCLRALEAGPGGRAQLWFVAAAVLNAVLGSARQIAWLGVLVMVPCALLYWNRRGGRLLPPAVVWAVCVVGIVLFLRWFNHQPYILPEPLLRGRFGPNSGRALIAVTTRVVFDAALFCTPVLCALLPWRHFSRRQAVVSGLLVLVVCGAVVRVHSNWHEWAAPMLMYRVVHPQTMENTFASTSMPPGGPAPEPLSAGVQLGTSALAVLGLCALALHLSGRRVRKGQSREVLILTIPLLLAYFLFLLPRGLFVPIFDRYLLLPLPFLIWLALHQAQQRSTRLQTQLGFGVLLLVAAYSVTTLHDFFATYRGLAVMEKRLKAAGVPRDRLDGGWEFDRYTQLLQAPFVRQTGIRLPNGQTLAFEPISSDGPCTMQSNQQVPTVRPLYKIVYPGSPCRLVQDVAPVTYRAWLPPFRRELLLAEYASGPATEESSRTK